jgi:hypothetical protein
MTAPEKNQTDARDPDGIAGGSYNVDEEFVEEHSDEQAQENTRPS